MSNKSNTLFPNPSFSCDSSHPALHNRFLKELLITEADIILGYLTLNDGSEWKLYLEGEALKRFVRANSEIKIPCLCSFQHWEADSSFDYRVICRKLAPKLVENSTWKSSGGSIGGTEN